MGSFLQNGMGIIDENIFNCDSDDIYDDIVKNVAQAKAILAESLELTDKKKLEEELQSKEAELQKLKEILGEKTKFLHELNGSLERVKKGHLQNRNQHSSSFDVVADVFKDIKIFKTKVTNEIRQKLGPHGIQIEFPSHDDRVTAKLMKHDKWFEFGLNDNIRLELLNMFPRHDRFDEIKVLFDSTMNFKGLFSIYHWN